MACAALRIAPSASAIERAPIQITSVEKLSAARIAWRCESISPGTDRPALQVDRPRAGPASFRIAADVPVATDPPIPNRQPFDNRFAIIDGHDLPVDENRVRRLRRTPWQ
jgi:hypothetical protein